MLVIPIILIVGLVYFLNDNERRGSRNRASAKEILDMRLAKGEITKEEYRVISATQKKHNFALLLHYLILGEHI